METVVIVVVDVDTVVVSDLDGENVGPNNKDFKA